MNNHQTDPDRQAAKQTLQAAARGLSQQDTAYLATNETTGNVALITKETLAEEDTSELLGDSMGRKYVTIDYEPAAEVFTLSYKFDPLRGVPKEDDTRKAQSTDSAELVGLVQAYFESDSFK